MKRSTSNFGKLTFKIIAVSLVAVCLIAFLYIIQIFIIMGIARSRAHSLAPPEYPNSEVIETWQSGGSEIMWDRKTYKTSDTIDQVLAFMEKHMPGFQKENDPKQGTIYRNYANDTSWFGKRAAEIACTTLFCIEKEALSYPGVSVTIYPDPDNPTDTLIEIWISWPAL